MKKHILAEYKIECHFENLYKLIWLEEIRIENYGI